MSDIEKLNSVKFNIRKALESQGSDITADTPFEEYPSYIMGGSGGSGGGGVAFGFDTFVSKWTQNPDDENVYDITIYAFSGNALNEIGTIEASREVDAETGDLNMVVGSITFTDSDYEVYEYLLRPAINGVAQNANYNEFFQTLVDGQFPTFGVFLP